MSRLDNKVVTIAYAIMHRMQEIARRLWIVCLPAFIAAILGVVQVIVFVEGKWLIPLFVILVVVASFCLGITIWAFFYDFRNTWEKEHPQKMIERAQNQWLRKMYPTMFKKKRL